MDAYFYSKNYAFSSAEQMAMDEWMLLQTDTLNAMGLRVYHMEETCTIGRNQRLASIKERTKDSKVLVRRPTGGGTVFHGTDLIYSLTIPTSHELYDLKLSELYYEIHTAINRVFEYFSLDAELFEFVQKHMSRTDLEVIVLISPNVGVEAYRLPENEATQTGAFAFGRGAKAAIQGKFAFANDRFSLSGDAQGGMYILRADTTDATATVLTTNNGTAISTNQIVAANDTCITFDGTITAMQNGAQAYASWKIEGLLVNDGGTTTLANSATTVISNEDSWGMALSADNTNNALAITCTGEASHNIRWVANIRTTEVTYA